MRKIIDIALNDLRIIFRERDIWINLVVLPMLLSFVIGLANGAGIQPSADGAAARGPDVRIDVIDEDNSALSQQFLTDLRAANASFVLCPADNDDSDRCDLSGAAYDAAMTEARLRTQTTLAFISIPAGFGAALEAGENTSIVYRANEDASAPSYILQAVEATAQRLGAAALAGRVGAGVAAQAPGLMLDAAEQAAYAARIRERAAALLDEQPPVVSSVMAQAQTPARLGGGGFSQSVPGMATMYVMFAVFPVAVALMAERRQGTLQRLVTMPLSRAQVLGGKMLARFVLGMLQYGIIFAFGYVLGVRYGGDPLAIALTMVMFTLCITALTLALSTLLKNENQAGSITLLLTLTLAPLGGAWWPLDIVPAWMRTLGHVSPVAWAMDSYTELIFFGGTLATVLPYLAVLAVMTAVLFLIGVARFKIE
jgi:ABC-2 type transport system permease protein